jgi:hypothetical protein
MGRTIPSFRIALVMEKEEWKPFRNALDKSDRKKFDEMFDIPNFYILLALILFSRCHFILSLCRFCFYHYKGLKECILEVEQIESRVNNNSSNKTRGLTKKEEEPTLDSYFIKKLLKVNNNSKNY